MAADSDDPVVRSRARLWLFRLLTALLALVLCAVGAEAVATAYLFAIAGEYVPARTRFASRTNTFIESLSSGGECGYVDTLFPHPYVGFVHHANSPCGMPGINNIGLFGTDFPSTRRDDRFVVLLTGGSVASQFALGIQNGPSYLERYLNERYISPTGRPFLVLNGGDGAWKQPQQTILFLLYADAVDAAVTLDGFNEHYQLDSAFRFEYPANNFLTVNPSASHDVRDVMALWMIGRMRQAAARNPILSRSQAAYFLVSAAQDYFTKRDESRPKPRTTVESIFRLPDWPAEQRRAWALEQYRKYLRSMHAIARVHDVRTAFFIQPAPALEKPLSDEEQKIAGDLAYGPLYKQMAENLVALNKEEIPVVSLLDVFKGDRRTLYADPIHLARDPDGTSKGYSAMAERMASDLGRLWHLASRKD